MKNIINSLAAISILFLASCAMDPSQKEEEAVAKSFKPQLGRSNVYVYRPRTLTPWAPRFGGLYLNDKLVGTLPDADNKFMMLDVAPGEYTITTGKNILGITTGEAKHKFTAYRNENVFLRFHPIFAVGVVVASTPQVSWKRATESEGRKDILKSKLVQGIETVN